MSATLTSDTVDTVPVPRKLILIEYNYIKNSYIGNKQINVEYFHAIFVRCIFELLDLMSTVKRFHNIYNGIIFPSLNPAKIFQLNSR